MANNILSYKGNQIGKSIKEKDCEMIIDEIFETSKNICILAQLITPKMFWLEKI